MSRRDCRKGEASLGLTFTLEGVSRAEELSHEPASCRVLHHYGILAGSPVILLPVGGRVPHEMVLGLGLPVSKPRPQAGEALVERRVSDTSSESTLSQDG